MMGMSKGYRSKLKEAANEQIKDNSNIRIMAVTNDNPLNKIKIYEKEKLCLVVVCQLIRVEGMIELENKFFLQHHNNNCNDKNQTKIINKR